MLSWLSLAFGAELTEPQKVEKIEAMYTRYKKVGFAKVPEIRPAEVDSLENPLFVDVRPDKERKVGWIPGSITQEAFEAGSFEDRTVVVYCTIGARSGLYAKKLLKRGHDVRNLAGSLLLWTHAGRPLEDAAGPTTKLHTYGKRWALVASGYEAVW